MQRDSERRKEARNNRNDGKEREGESEKGEGKNEKMKHKSKIFTSVMADSTTSTVLQDV